MPLCSFTLLYFFSQNIFCYLKLILFIFLLIWFFPCFFQWNINPVMAKSLFCPLYRHRNKFQKVNLFEDTDLVGDKTRHQPRSSDLKSYTLFHAKSLQSCPTLCNSMDCSPPGSSAHGILQARMLEWAAISFSMFLLYCFTNIKSVPLRFMDDAIAQQENCRTLK